MIAQRQHITPFLYHARGFKAIDIHNTKQSRVVNENAGELSDLQSTILECLKDQPKGMRSMALMLHVRRRINADRFHVAINSLLTLKYIIRTQINLTVYYSITLEGRAVLDELNEILIAIVHGREKDLS